MRQEYAQYNSLQDTQISKHTNIRVQSEHCYFTFSLTSGMQHHREKLSAFHAMDLAPNVAVSVLLSYSYAHRNATILCITSCQCKDIALSRSRLQNQPGNVKLHTVST